MALVRCPTHKIPYNDENPRGCPACAREEEGERSGSIMQELARAQDKQTTKPTDRRGTDTETRGSTTQRRPNRSVTPHPFVVRTQPPKVPVVEEGPLGKVLRLSGQRQLITAGAVTIVVLLVSVLFLSRPRFVEGSFPPVTSASQLRPLPLETNRDIQLAFSALGVQSPRAHPDNPQLMRYTFGEDMVIDTRNSRIYAITLRVPNRTWHGLWTGMPERRAEGQLALLAEPQAGTQSSEQPTEVRGYQTYPSLDARPRRTLRAEVRPPNGCYDVELRLQPRAIGVLHKGGQRLAAVARAGRSLEWVVTQIRVVSRSLRGPSGDGIACQ